MGEKFSPNYFFFCGCVFWRHVIFIINDFIMKRLTTEDVINKIKKIHGDLYDCSQVNYINAKTKIRLFCNKHKIWFDISPNDVLYKKSGCPKCRYEKSSSKTRKSLDNFIKEANKIHSGKYDYSKVNYVNNRTKVCIICKKHGEFWQTPDKHILRKHGCPICGGSMKKSLRQFVEEAIKVHGNRYDYSKSVYKNGTTPTIIICPTHGEFKQTPKEHLNGQGCPHCKQSKIERELYDYLSSKQIDFVHQYRYDESNYKNRIDFYLTKLNLAIECQGIQHFKPVDFANKGKVWAENAFCDNVKRDVYKHDLCEMKSIKLLYYIPIKDLKSICLTDKCFNGIYKKENTFYKLEELEQLII